MSVLSRLTITETKLFFREPISVIFGLALAPVLIIVLGSIPAFREPNPGFGGLRVIDVYTPIVVTIAIQSLAITVLPQQFATYRDKGVLRRLRTTPVRPVAMLGAQLLMSATLALGSALVILAIARVIFGVPLPQHLPAYLVAFVLSALALFALGMLVAAVAPTAMSASAIGLVLFFPLLFFGGLWIPRASMSGMLLTISDFTPLGAGVQAFTDAAGGAWPQSLHLAVMLGWTIVAGGLAARYFRWE